MCKISASRNDSIQVITFVLLGALVKSIPYIFMMFSKNQIFCGVAKPRHKKSGSYLFLTLISICGGGGVGVATGVGELGIGVPDVGVGDTNGEGKGEFVGVDVG